jgi:hypothetical protein
MHPSVLLLIVASTVLVSAQSKNPVELSLEKTTINVGEPVVLRVQVKNTMSAPVEVDLGLNGQDDILISIAGPSGKHSQKPKPGPREGMAFFGWKHLETGEEFSEALVLNEWFEFKETGQYQIEIKLKTPGKVGQESLPIDTTSLTLEVRPYDREKLTSVCRDLASRIGKRESADDVLAAGAAERALSYIHDPIVVPYWDQVLEYSALTAIPSLGRVGNSDAVRVLSRALRLPDKVSQLQARSVLQALAEKAPDPSVRIQAENALKSR